MVCGDIICVDSKPENEGLLFFGDYGKYLRIDKMYYPVFKNLYEASQSNTWFFDEIDFSKDKRGWELLPENAKRMFKLNIDYQNLMDSAVPNIFAPLAEYVTITELSYLYGRIYGEEKIHALSYSSGISQVFDAEADKILNLIYSDKKMRDRMEIEIETARTFKQLCLLEGRKDDEAKKAILDVLLAVYFLEGVKFPFSFFVTWSINREFNNAIQGFSQLLKLIAWDEMTVHTVTGANVLSILRKEKRQGFKHLFDNGWFAKRATELAQITADGEMEWSKYLLEDGAINGYNEAIGESFIKYWTDKRLKDIKLDPIFNERKNDIIDWYNDYRDLNKTQVALQEADALNYQKGKLKNDFDNDANEREWLKLRKYYN